MTEREQRLKTLRRYLKKVQSCDWVEVIFATDLKLVFGQHEGKICMGTHELPEQPLSRWVANDLAGLSHNIRFTTIHYLEARIKELESQE